MAHKKLIVFLFVLLAIPSVFSQDIHLSQFYASDHFLNPGYMGAHKGDMRIIANYRNQWKQIDNFPLTTMAAAVDKTLHYYNQDFSVGLAAANDQFSGFKTVTNKFFLTGSYAKEFFNSEWRLGLQTGIVTNSTDLAVQTFPNQWDYPNGQFDPGIPNGEINIRPSQMYVDVNTGLTWSKKIGGITVLSGLAFNHINRPKDTYFNQVAERRKIRGVFHTMVSIPVGTSFQIEPKNLWMWTTKANDFLLGSNVRYLTGLTSIRSIYSGLFYRHGINRTFDAVYPVLGLVYKEFDFGLSYDFNLSSLSAGIKRPKSVEFSLIYTLPSSKVQYKIIPCDRY